MEDWETVVRHEPPRHCGILQVVGAEVGQFEVGLQDLRLFPDRTVKARERDGGVLELSLDFRRGVVLEVPMIIGCGGVL